MKIANVVLKKTIEESSETRRVQKTFVRVVGIEVASVATEAEFIPLASDKVLLHGSETVASIIPTPFDLNFFKDMKPTKLQPTKGFEFSERKFSICAVVELPFTRVSSRDPFVPMQTYQPQVVLLPIWGEIELPEGARLAGVLDLEGYSVSAQDNETKQTYQLGYRFQVEDQVNWIGLALARRKHSNRAEKEDADLSPSSPVQTSQPAVSNAVPEPQNLVRVKDRLVLQQLRTLYRFQMLQSYQSTDGWVIEDPEHRLHEAEDFVASRRTAVGNEDMLDREFFPEVFV